MRSELLAYGVALAPTLGLGTRLIEQWRTRRLAQRQESLETVRFFVTLRVSSDRLVTLEGAAALAGVHPRTVRSWLRRGILTPAHDGPVPRYQASDVWRAEFLTRADRSRRHNSDS